MSKHDFSAAEFAARSAAAGDVAPLNVIVDQLVPYYVSQNAEPEAWAAVSAYIERITNRSSACFARCG
mgnify:CR=1 FL=1